MGNGNFRVALFETSQTKECFEMIPVYSIGDCSSDNMNLSKLCTRRRGYVVDDDVASMIKTTRRFCQVKAGGSSLDHRLSAPVAQHRKRSDPDYPICPHHCTFSL